MLDHVIANQVATAIILTYVTYSLSLHPLWQTKLRAELNNLSTSPDEKFPSARALDTLSILDAIVTNQRLHHPSSHNNKYLKLHTPSQRVCIPESGGMEARKMVGS
jgi:hypothetical protein